MNWLNFWTIAAAIGQVLATLFALGALIYSIRTIALSNYGTLDQLYAELLKAAVSKPHLRTENPSRIAKRTEEEQAEYEIYAHLAWCFVETVHDHYYSGFIKNEKLLRTWESAVRIESQLHRDWFERIKATKNHYFKKDFYEWIEEGFSSENKI